MGVRRAAWAVAAVVGVGLAAEFVAWWVATDRLLAAYAGWRQSLGGGWSVVSEAPVREGWPFAARLRLDGVRLGQVGGGIAWSAERVTFGVGLLHPGTLSVRPFGGQVFSAPGIAVQWRADRLEVTAPLGKARSAHVAGRGVTVSTRWGDAIGDSVDADIGWAAQGARLSVAVGPVVLPAGHRWGLGGRTTTAAVDLAVHGAWPAGAPAAAAARWRDAGGAVEMSRIGLQWGALDVSGHGQGGLDGALQPDATLSLRVADPPAVVSMMADAGAIGAGAATAMEAVLGLLAMPDRLAGRPVVLTLPAQVSGGMLSVGAIPVMKVPAIGWPAP